MQLPRFLHVYLITYALVLSVGLSACTDQPKFSAIDITGVDYAKGFELIDQEGRPRALGEFKGKVVVLFFGYTQCPDVCPTSLAELADVKKALGAQGELMQGIFVSLDPERDTQELLKAYMGNFDSSFLALRPTLDQLPALAKSFKIYYKKVPGSQPNLYTLDHSAGSYVYDPQGKLRLYVRYGSGSENLSKDIKLLLQRST
jgi:protein SCO1/2